MYVFMTTVLENCSTIYGQWMEGRKERRKDSEININTRFMTAIYVSAADGSVGVGVGVGMSLV